MRTPLNASNPDPRFLTSVIPAGNIVATANDVTKLPAEFLRKGRFDEIFFVDLPDAESREAIFRIHLNKRGKPPEGFDLPGLVAATDQFSGAEIEQAIVSALYTAFAEKTGLTSKGLLAEVQNTRPLATTPRKVP